MVNVVAPRFDYDIDPIYLNDDMSNKLFCTFATEDTLEGVLATIQERYRIIYNKIFVLYSKSQDEYICTYNVDFGNVGNFIDNTILVHRKKESNTLYTINALNTLIKELNGGVLDTSYRINWSDFRNCVLLTKGPELKRVNTTIFFFLNYQIIIASLYTYVLETKIFLKELTGSVLIELQMLWWLFHPKDNRYIHYKKDRIYLLTKLYKTCLETLP